MANLVFDLTYYDKLLEKILRKTVVGKNSKSNYENFIFCKNPKIWGLIEYHDPKRRDCLKFMFTGKHIVPYEMNDKI